MNDHDLLLAIQELLDGVQWDGDTLCEVARLMEENGYHIGDSTIVDDDARRING